MGRAFSLYLDLVRFVAALGVFLHHLETGQITGKTLWWRMGAYGEECVTIFFVLSGFVIAHVVSTRETSLGSYAINRFSRIYSVLLPALLLTLVADAVGTYLAPLLYKQGIPNFDSSNTVQGYLSTLLLVNEWQVFQWGGLTAGSNTPFWSLSFEWLYYAVAGLIFFARPLLACVLTAVLFVLGGKTIAILFPLWLLGVGSYRLISKVELPVALSVFLAIASVLLILMMPDILEHLKFLNFGVEFPWGVRPFNRHIGVDYVTGMAFAIHLFAMWRLLSGFNKGLDSSAPLIRKLGLMTFPLYCFHFPMVFLMRAISPWETQSMWNVLFISVGTLLCVTMLTPVCERLKNKFRSMLFTRCASFSSSVTKG